MSRDWKVAADSTPRYGYVYISIATGLQVRCLIG